MKTLGLVAADFNKDIVNTMIEAVQQAARVRGVAIEPVVRVPGAYEIPFVAESLLSLAACDGLVVLGFIERGETLHGEVMGHVVHRALLDAQVRHGKPMGLGIIGPGATPEQAKPRAQPYAVAALDACLAALAAREQIVAARGRG